MLTHLLALLILLLLLISLSFLNLYTTIISFFLHIHLFTGMSLPKKEELTAQGLDMLRIESLKNGEDLALRSVVRDRGSLQAASLSTKDTGIGVGADIEAEVDLQGDAPLSLAQGQKRPKSPTIRHRADVASRLGVDLVSECY
jgi:hypothetical protein